MKSERFGLVFLSQETKISSIDINYLSTNDANIIFWDILQVEDHTIYPDPVYFSHGVFMVTFSRLVWPSIFSPKIVPSRVVTNISHDVPGFQVAGILVSFLEGTPPYHMIMQGSLPSN